MYRFNLLNNLCKYVKKILSLFILKRPSYNGGGGGGGGGERIDESSPAAANSLLCSEIFHVCTEEI